MQNSRKSGKIDKKLIERCCKGSIKDFEKLFVLYGDKILNYIHNYIREDLATSKDLMQETFISVYKGIKRLKDPNDFYNWIYTIASNKCRDHLRKQKNRAVVDSELLDDIEDTRVSDTASSSNSVDMEMINEIIGLMPGHLREVFIMRKYEKMKFEDISKASNCSLRTAKYRMKKAINIFSKALQKRGFNFES